ncbi:hypothetical protein GUJ93_ZPchr0013g35392 [Zizania palustris]|uniref:Uncharacterized protein n=1 Tax=Zizania palustris TaxID=103762 RepID=A0A8J5WZN6_ZIZPA|nr:hypothetical protein GUJ93_ZPchr0013g35392 [Zizania palustris]
MYVNYSISKGMVSLEPSPIFFLSSVSFLPSLGQKLKSQVTGSRVFLRFTATHCHRNPELSEVGVIVCGLQDVAFAAAAAAPPPGLGFDEVDAMDLRGAPPSSVFCLLLPHRRPTSPKHLPRHSASQASIVQMGFLWATNTAISIRLYNLAGEKSLSVYSHSGTKLSLSSE